jgi:hypothetical protein
MKTLRKSTRPPWRVTVAASAGALALVACGGGSGGGSGSAAAPGASAVTSVPAAASTSVTALVTWASTLPQSDVTQPLATASFSPPESDTMDALPIL